MTTVAALWHGTLWPSAAMAQEAGGGGTRSSSRGWIVEALIVAALCGLALFVICRSSHRN